MQGKSALTNNKRSMSLPLVDDEHSSRRGQMVGHVGFSVVLLCKVGASVFQRQMVGQEEPSQTFCPIAGKDDSPSEAWFLEEKVILS